MASGIPWDEFREPGTHTARFINVPRIRCSRIKAGNSDARFQEEVQGAKVKPRRTRLDMDIILPTSAKSARKAAESLAYYFKREFQEVYGNFYVETPVSKAMGDFLARMGECRHCGTRRICEQCQASSGG